MNALKALRNATLLPLAALAFSTAAQATVLTYNYTGTVFAMHAPLDISNGGVFAVGQAVSGTFSYDDTAVDADPGNPLLGYYLGSTSATITFADVGAGSYTASFTGGQFSISDSHCCGGDSVSFGLTAPPSWGPAVNGWAGETAQFAIFDYSGTAITGDALSGFVLPPFSAFDGVTFGSYLQFGDGESHPTVYYSVDSLVAAPAPAPAPGALALLGLGLLGIGGMRRRKRAA